MPRDKIFTVARIFTYLGWPLLILFGLMAVLSLAMAPVLFFSGGEARTGVVAMLFGGVLFVAFASVGWLYLATAKRLRNRDPQAAPVATLLCILLLLGFPIFTLAGVYCYVLLRAYPDYLAAEQPVV